MNGSEIQGSGSGNDNTTALLICPGSDGSIEHIFVLLYSILLPVIIILNGSVVLLVLKSKPLHNRAMYLSLQLAVINLIQGTFNYGTIWITCIIGGWAFGNIGCQSTALVVYGLASARWTIILVLTIDRLLTVFSPFYYPRYAGKIATVLSLLGWSVAIVKAVIPLQGILDCYAFDSTSGRCDIYCTATDECVLLIQLSRSFDFITAIFSMFLYITLFIKGKQLTNKIVATATKKSNRWTKSDKRIAKTFLILSLTLIGSTLPIFMLDMTISITMPPLQNPSLSYIKYIHGAARVMMHSVVITDPVVILRNQDVRTAIWTEWHKLKSRLQVRSSQSKKKTVPILISITPITSTD